MPAPTSHEQERAIFPTAANNHITDAVTQLNVKVIAEAPAMAMGSIYQNMAHSTGILFQNVVAGQQQNIIHQAATMQGAMQLYALDTASTSVATTHPPTRLRPSSTKNAIVW